MLKTYFQVLGTIRQAKQRLMLLRLGLVLHIHTFEDVFFN